MEFFAIYLRTEYTIDHKKFVLLLTFFFLSAGRTLLPGSSWQQFKGSPLRAPLIDHSARTRSHASYGPASRDRSDGSVGIR